MHFMPIHHQPQLPQLQPEPAMPVRALLVCERAFGEVTRLSRMAPLSQHWQEVSLTWLFVLGLSQ